jgi:hypothetical protein
VPTYTIRADSSQWATLSSFGQSSTTTAVLNGTADTKDVLAYAQVSATNDPGIDGNGVQLTQFAFRFDCSSITASETISSVTLTMRPDYIDANGRALSAVKYDWGSTVDSGDFRTPSQLAACSVYATKTFNTADQNTNVNLTLSGSTLATDVAARGTVRMLLVFTSNISGTFPDGTVSFYDPSNGTASYRPTLTVVTTGGNVSLSRNVADSSTVSDALTRSTARSRAAADRLASLDSEELGYVYLPGVASNYLSVPDAAALDVTGDIDLRVRVALDDWTPTTEQQLIAKYLVTGNQRSYRLSIRDTTGFVRLAWSNDGTTETFKQSTVAPTVLDGQPLWVRATLTVNNGSSQNEVRFYTSSDGSTWAQLGSTVTTAGTTSVYASTSLLEVGTYNTGASNPAALRCYRAQVLNGIGGTTVLDVDCSAITSAAATTFTATTGQTVTINKAGTRQAVAVLPISDTLALPRGATDALTSSDALARSGARSRAADDSVAVSDAAAGARSLARAVADSLTASDTVGIRRDNAAPVLAALTLADTIATLGTRARAVADSLAASETVARSVGRSRSAADSVTAADAAARVLAVARQIVDGVTLTGVAEVLGTAGQMSPGAAPAASITASTAPGSTMTRSTAPTSTMTGA